MPPVPALRNPVGAHLKVGSGLLTGLLPQARVVGAEAVQVFVGNPRGWSLSPGDPAVDEAFAQIPLLKHLRATAVGRAA